MFGLRWTPGIGDPTVTGWLTVLAYVAAAWLCLRAMMAEKAGSPRPSIETIRALLRVLSKNGRSPPAPAKRSAIWLTLAAILAFLGLNKQLDLQTLLTEIGRIVLSHGGFYGQRRLLQTAFVLGFGLAGLALLLSLFRMARGPLRDFRTPFFGVTLIVAFVLTRAASFHHVDSLLGGPSLGSYVNFFFELTGIVLIGASAHLRTLRP